MSARPEPTADRIVWIDGEMTGLAPNSDMLLEIAVVVTDGNLQVLGEFSEVVHQPLDKVISRMDPYVLRMHSSSGLLEEVGNTTPASCGPMVEQEVIAFLNIHGAIGSTVAGSSIHFDRAFLDVWMRDLNRNALHYRNLDVSTVKEIARHHAPEVFATAPAKLLEHRALADIHESIAELRHYINAGLFTPSTPAHDDRAQLANVAEYVKNIQTGFRYNHMMPVSNLNGIIAALIDPEQITTALAPGRGGES